MSSHYIKCHYITLNVITLHEITYIQANIAAYHFATGINLAPPLFPWGRAQSKELLPGQLAAGNDNGRPSTNLPPVPELVDGDW